MSSLLSHQSSFPAPHCRDFERRRSGPAAGGAAPSMKSSREHASVLPDVSYVSMGSRRYFDPD